MLYVYTIFIPLGIIFLVKQLSKSFISSFRGIVSLLFKSLPYLYGYGFLLYYLESEKKIATGWKAYSFFFFLIPISLIILFLKSYFHFTKRRQRGM